MSAVLAVIAGFASALGGVLWDLMAVIGCIITISIALLVLWCIVATHGQRKPMQGAEPKVIAAEPEVIDDALPRIFKRGPVLADHVSEAIAQMERDWRAQQEDGRG